jgi:hypothetical protein
VPQISCNRKTIGFRYVRVIVSTLHKWGTLWRGRLRHCATSQKVESSISGGVIGIFHWHNLADRTVALGVDSASNRNEHQENLLWGKGGRCVELTTLPHSCADCHEILNLKSFLLYILCSWLCFILFWNNVIPWLPCCPWDNRDHVTTFAAARTVAGPPYPREWLLLLSPLCICKACGMQWRIMLLSSG